MRLIIRSGPGPMSEPALKNEQVPRPRAPHWKHGGRYIATGRAGYPAVDRPEPRGARTGAAPTAALLQTPSILHGCGRMA